MADSPACYLTIDDSPSTRMDDLVDFLDRRNAQALFFCRGDKLNDLAGVAMRAVMRGQVLGNHGFSHTRFSQLSFDEMVDEIEKTERIIDKIYAALSIEKPGQYFRFPHLDRGTGSWIVDYDAFDLKEKAAVKAIFTEGLNVISAAKPSAEDIEKKEQLQEYLKLSGYTAPFPQANVSWYQHPECQEAADCLFTYSTADWMISQRHEGRWRYKTEEDLLDKMRSDPWLLKKESTGIVLAHDQAEIIDTTIELITFMISREMRFLPIGT
jgi:peptidoglycan/xylan/chitin deacetylase (PgdA/CDA1 family)